MSDTDPIKPNNENSIILKPTPGSSSDSETASKVLSWIVDQLTMLAEAFGEALTDERMEIYARDLVDIPRDRLNIAFELARRERTFFPKVAELRSLATSSSEDEKKVEANAAWDHVNQYLRKWGVDLLPLFSGGGKVTTPPPLDARIDYALRRIGGLRALNQVDIDKRPFMYRDFCEAYALAPVAELMALPLQRQFGEDRLLGNVRELTQTTTVEQHVPDHSDDWIAKRREELKRQAEELLAKRKGD